MLRAALIAGVAMTASAPVGATQWLNYHWATDGSGLKVRVNSSISAVWQNAPAGAAIGPVPGAVADWETSTVLTLNPQSSTADPKRCSPINTQILVCNAAYGKRGWLGIANIWTNGDHIYQATTKLNDSYFASGSYNQPKWRNMVACQEIGHDFGLDHQDENFSNANLGTCMDYTNDPAPSGGPNNEHPDQLDYDTLTAMYNHGDGTNSATFAAPATNFGIRAVGQALRAGYEPAGTSRTEWGTAIHRDAKGRPDVFVKGLGGIHKLITHVFWAVEASGHEAD
ncbi:MAG: hypothetical protein ABIO85_03605 [Sphingomicrobium sp.]